MPQPLRYRGYWDDAWDDALGGTPNQGWNSGAALAWYWLASRPYDPRLRRFLQPDPSKQGALPDYSYAHDDPLDVSDPQGLELLPPRCWRRPARTRRSSVAACNGSCRARLAA